MLTTLPLRTSRVVRSLCLLSCAALGVTATQAAANEGDVLYQGAPARVTANVERWGEDCGVRPKSYTLNERPQVTVERQGDELLLHFPSGTVHSNLCWSQNPALQLVSTSARPGAWKTRCETPPGEPKRETGVYEIVARDEKTLELTESSRYDWQLKSSHCIATVRTVRTLTRISPADEVDEPIPVAEEPAVEGEQPAEEDCVAGSLASLDILPTRARVEPGANFCFAVRGRDAQGCRIQDPPIHWSVEPLDHGRGRMRGHCFRSADSAAEGEGRFRITARSGKLSARALIRVVTPDLSDITLHDLRRGPGTVSASGEAVDASGLQPESRVAARAMERSNERVLWLGGLAALAALLAGGATWMALRKREPQPADGAAAPPPVEPPESDTETSDESGRAASPPPAAVAAAQPTEPMICPQCRRGYAPGTERCESDGTVLIPYKEFTAQAASTQAVCQGCGARWDDGSTFCGKCGARLSS